MLRGRTSPNIA